MIMESRATSVHFFSCQAIRRDAKAAAAAAAAAAAGSGAATATAGGSGSGGAGAGAGMASGATSESVIGGHGVAAVGGGGWVRHGMELDGLGTLWEIVLNAPGKKM